MVKTNKKTKKGVTKQMKPNVFESVLSVLAPKSLNSFKQCMFNNCKSLYNKYTQNSKNIVKQMKQCNTKYKTKKDVKNCIKKVNNSPYIVQMKKCRKSNCNKETNNVNQEIARTIKKLSSKHRSKPKPRTKSKPRTRK